jgi:hypothetical protein
MKLNVMRYIILLYIIIFSSPAFANLLVLQPDGAAGKDCQINDEYPTSNYENNPYLLSNNNGTDHGVIEFNVSSIPPGSTINSATLEIFEDLNCASNINLIEAHLINTPWAENTVTWTTPWVTPGGDYGPSLGTCTGDTESCNWLIFNMTSVVQQWVNNAVTNNGIMITGPGGGDTIKYVRSSDEAIAANRPILRINYTPPTSLSAKPKSSTQITIGWRDNSTDETGFKIEKKTGACDSANSWAQIATKASNTTSYNVTNLTPNTSYSFRVRAYQSSSNSNYSNCVTAKTSAAGTPPAPTNFKAKSASSTKVNLTWSDNSTNETGFKIYRKAGAGAWALLTTTAAYIKNFSDTAATNNTTTTTYQYYIVASNASGISPATYTATIPYQPMNLTTAQGTTAGKVKLTWTDKSSNETGFEVYRKSGDCLSASTWAKVASLGANKNTWTDAGRTSGSTYAYKIRGYTKSGSVLSVYGYSMYCNCVSATAP